MTTDSKPKLGYLGLGLMGSQMCKKLVDSGYQVTAYDPVAEKVEAAVANGVIAADSPRAVAEASDIVQACVITTPALIEAVMGQNGIIEGGGAGLMRRFPVAHPRRVPASWLSWLAVMKPMLPLSNQCWISLATTPTWVRWGRAKRPRWSTRFWS